MDLVQKAVEEREIKKENDTKDYLSTILLDDLFFSNRNFVGKGKKVQQSGKQKKEIQAIAQLICVSEANIRNKEYEALKSEKDEIDELRNFDLTSIPRIFLKSGFITINETCNELFDVKNI
jgi:hypothetical protein